MYASGSPVDLSVVIRELRPIPLAPSRRSGDRRGAFSSIAFLKFLKFFDASHFSIPLKSSQILRFRESFRGVCKEYVANRAISERPV